MGNNIVLNYDNININNYFMFSLPKVGNCTIYKILYDNNKILHSDSYHDTIKFKYYVDNYTNNMFICGVRNPFDLIYSSYFELFWRSGIVLKTSRYPNGYYTHKLCDINMLHNYSDDEIIKDYFDRQYLFTYFIDFMYDIINFSNFSLNPNLTDSSGLILFSVC